VTALLSSPVAALAVPATLLLACTTNGRCCGLCVPGQLLLIMLHSHQLPTYCKLVALAQGSA
jgi:hypothetical protein